MFLCGLKKIDSPQVWKRKETILLFKKGEPRKAKSRRLTKKKLYDEKTCLRSIKIKDKHYAAFITDVDRNMREFTVKI